MVTDEILRILDQSYPQSATAQSMATQIGQPLASINFALGTLVMQGKALLAPGSTALPVSSRSYLSIVSRMRLYLEQQTQPITPSTAAHTLGMQATNAKEQLDKLVSLQIATKRTATPEDLYSKVS